MTSEAESLVDDMIERPGAILLRARKEKGMSLTDVAEITRVAHRQLEAIERSDFASLPGTPYAVGFARAYARAVGADEVAIARGVREELGAMDATDRYEAFEPVDPTRIPPRMLAWTAAAVALLMAVGYGVWRTQFFSASTDQEIADLANRAEAARPAVVQQEQPPQTVAGPVVLTAVQDVWLRIYDQSGERLFERQLSQGESYTVPPEANNPMILTGRPDALAVTVGGKPVAPLGPPEKTIADVPVSAAALLARPVAGTAPTPTPTPTASAPTASTLVPVSPPAAAPAATASVLASQRAATTQAATPAAVSNASPPIPKAAARPEVQPVASSLSNTAPSVPTEEAAAQ